MQLLSATYSLIQKGFLSLVTLTFHPQKSAIAPAVALALTLGTSLHAHAASADNTPINWQLGYTGEAASIVEGGARRGSAYAGQLFVGADIDLEKALGWSNTQIHVAFTNRHGKNLAETHIGNSTSVQEIYGGQNTRMARLTVASTFLDGKLQVEAGRTVANISFLGSELCQYFQTNSACGNPTFVFRTSSFTWWPVSSWGAHAQYWLSDNLYFHAGVYEENTAHQGKGDHGFDWSVGDSTGVIVPVTLGYQTTWENDRYPKRYEIGGWYDSADYADPLYDEAGDYAVVTNNDYATLNGRSGVFARFEHVVSRPYPTSKRSLTLFGALLTGTSGELIEDFYYKAGFVKRGTFSNRDNDSIGFVITRQYYSHNALENQRLARALNGGSGRPAGSQTMLELSYGIYVNDNVRVQPNIHYIINPDQFSQPERTEALDDAVVIGLRFDINLRGLMGL